VPLAVQHRLAGEVTTYTLDYAANFQVLFEQGGAFANTKHYLYGLACLGEHIDADDPQNSEWRYYQRDGSSLVRQTTNEQAEVTLAWTYSPEGMVLLGEKGPVTNLDCAGNATYDFSTGLIFKNGRYFDPNTGIWITLSGLVIYQAGLPVYKRKRKGKKGGRDNKRYIFLLLLLLLALTLAGCGGGSDPSCPPPEADLRYEGYGFWFEGFEELEMQVLGVTVDAYANHLGGQAQRAYIERCTGGSEGRGWRKRHLLTRPGKFQNPSKFVLDITTICSYNSAMQEFDWDEDKRLINVQKHTIDFEDATIIFDGDIVTVEDDRFDYGKQRFITLGLLKGRVIAVVHTEQSAITRIISARKATKNERITYFEQVSY